MPNIKIKVICHLFVFLLLLSSGNIRAADINYNYKQISIEQGISHSNVTSVLKDHSGRLWIGTSSGLNLFDQHELTIFLHEKDNSNTLLSNNILFVMEDANNNIWVSTSSGLIMYHAETDSFIPYIYERVHSWLLIPGGILFSGDNKLFRYNYSNHTYYTIAVNSSIVSPKTDQYKIFKMHGLGNGLVLLSSKNEGFFKYEMNTDNVEPLSFGRQLTMTAIHVDDQGNIYCSYFNKGLFCYNSEGELISHYTSENSGLSNDIILDITEEKGDLWLGTDGGGISILNRDDNSFRVLNNVPGDPSSLPVNSITRFYHDAENNLWVGSVRGGLIQIKETFIRLYKDVALNSNIGLSEKVVISLFEDNDSILWIGTDGGGINRYNPFTNHFTHYANTYGDKVVSITNLTQTELLVSLFSKGVFIFDKLTGNYQPFIIVDSLIHQRENFGGFMPLIHRTGEDEILILSQNVYFYHPSQKQFVSVVSNEPDVNISALFLHYADDNHIFLSKGNSIFSIDRDNYMLNRITTLEEVEVIHSVCYDGQGLFWIGSDKGLSNYDMKDETVHQIETKMFNEITSLHLDDMNRLWINAQNSLFSYIIPQNRFIIWGESEGFTPNEILYKYQKPSQTNNIYLGSINGLVIIDKNILNPVAKNNNVSLLNILYNGKSSLSMLDVKEQSINVPYNYTSLAIVMGLRDGDFFSRDLYRYTISGLNSNYTETYNQRISLPQLTPGEYIITASYVTYSGEWSPPAHIVTINIMPPWYLSTWFILLSVLLAGGIVVSILTVIHRRNLYRLELEKKKMEQSINEEKIRFLENVSHELRTPLTLIYAPLKRLLNETFSVEHTKKQLGNIFRQALHMKGVINMTLDINKFNSGYDSIQKEPNMLNNWIREVGEDFRSELYYKQIKLDYHLDNEITEVMYDKNKCRIVLSNFLMNSLKFSESGSSITITTEKKGNEVVVMVSDQGIGLQHTNNNELFSRFYQGDHQKGGSGIGLSYSKMLVNKHGGTIGAANNSPQGAIFFFTLPITHQSNIEQVSYDEENEQPVLSSDKSVALSSCSVLIVDDNQEFLSFLSESFTGRFAEVRQASDGVEALATLKEFEPDIIISDVMMPRMDGYELCRQIKSTIQISHIPVVLLTAKSDAESVEIGYKLGADFYIAKPFDPDFLELIISNLLTAREVLKQRYKNSEERLQPEEATISSADEKFMLRFNSLIGDNLCDPDFNVDFLASELAMSRASLYNKMQSLLGIGVNDYINKYRIDEAAELLKGTEMSIGEISFETGFRNQRYFSTVFKKIKGVSPSEYRNKKM